MLCAWLDWGILRVSSNLADSMRNKRPRKRNKGGNYDGCWGVIKKKKEKKLLIPSSLLAPVALAEGGPERRGRRGEGRVIPSARESF